MLQTHFYCIQAAKRSVGVRLQRRPRMADIHLGSCGAIRGLDETMQSDPILLRELAAIRRIIADETWLEGERRGCPVSPDDPVVREAVCAIVLRIGQQLRDSLTDGNPTTP